MTGRAWRAGRLALWALALSAPVLSSVTAGGAQAAAAPEAARAAARGRALARAHCAMCHAVEESGRSPNRLAPPFRSLHSAFPVGDLIDAITQGARTGHPEMPQFRFSFEQGQDLVTYVRSIQERP